MEDLIKHGERDFDNLIAFISDNAGYFEGNVGSKMDDWKAEDWGIAVEGSIFVMNNISMYPDAPSNMKIDSMFPLIAYVDELGYESSLYMLEVGVATYIGSALRNVWHEDH